MTTPRRKNAISLEQIEQLNEIYGKCDPESFLQVVAINIQRDQRIEWACADDSNSKLRAIGMNITRCLKCQTQEKPNDLNH